MPIFKIKKFIETDKSSDLEEWHNKLDDSGRGSFAARIAYLSGCETTAGWCPPHCRMLGDGIVEIRFKCKKVQQRPLGYFGPGRKEFTFLFPAIEKGDEFIPKDAIERALERKNIVEKNAGRSNDWDI